MNNKQEEFEEFAQEEISELVLNGFTSGVVDGENGKHCTWKLELDYWED